RARLLEDPRPAARLQRPRDRDPVDAAGRHVGYRGARRQCRRRSPLSGVLIMSRVGKHPVEVPKGVTVALAGRTITAKGKLGELKLDLSNEVDATVEGEKITVTPRSTSKQSRTMWGTTRALLNNMVRGVSTGFTRRLEINGVGY